jgi:hypothetical protein
MEALVQSRFWICCAALMIFVNARSQSAAQTAQTRQPLSAAPHKFKAAVENPAFEWFFLLV